MANSSPQQGSIGGKKVIGGGNDGQTGGDSQILKGQSGTAGSHGQKPSKPAPRSA